MIMNAKPSQRENYGDTNARGRARSRHLELYTRSIFRGLKKKSAELLPPAAADRTVGVGLMETRSRNEDKKLSTEPGQLQRKRKELESFSDGVLRGLILAEKSARRIARMYGTPIYRWRNGKVVADKP